MKKKIFMLLALAVTVMTASASAGYSLKKGTSEHGTITFSVGGNDNAASAAEGDVVTVTVTPADGYVVNEPTGEWQAAVAASRGQLRTPAPAGIDLLKDVTLTPVTGQDNQWTFTMVRADVEVSATYKKLLTNTDITVAAITDQTYTGQPIEPAVTVKDGTATLAATTDYTVSYDANTDAGTATVTVTAATTSTQYAGETSTTFTINKADAVVVTAPEVVKGLVFNESPQALITAGTCTGGTMKYSLDGESYSTNIPEATPQGSYTIYYMVEGDANHNSTEPATLTMSIATNKHVLGNVIYVSEAYLKELGEDYPEIAETLSDAIDEAELVYGDNLATQAATDEATDKLEKALKAAQAKRVEADATTTAIGTVQQAEAADVWYDVKGRRLAGKPTTPGLYIKNGKKIILK